MDEKLKRKRRSIIIALVLYAAVLIIEHSGILPDSIAENHSLSKEQIIKDNNLTDEQLKVGSTLLLRETGPLLTVRITETRSYTEKTAYKTIKKADKEMYEGDTEVTREGKKGKSVIVDKTVSVNGEVVETHNLKKEVEKKLRRSL